MALLSCSKYHNVFTARQISSPCENDRFSFAIDHQPAKSEDKRGKHEASRDIRCRSHPVSNEREEENRFRSPAITGHGFA